MNPDVRAKFLDPFELEAGNLDDERVDVLLRGLDERGAEVAADENTFAGRLEDVADHRRDRALAVGAGDADDRRLGEVARQLQLADHRDAALDRLAQQDRIARDAGAGDHQVHALQPCRAFEAEVNLAGRKFARREVGFLVRQ